MHCVLRSTCCILCTGKGLGGTYSVFCSLTVVFFPSSAGTDVNTTDALLVVYPGKCDYRSAGYLCPRLKNDVAAWLCVMLLCDGIIFVLVLDSHVVHIY